MNNFIQKKWFTLPKLSKRQVKLGQADKLNLIARS